MTKKRASDRQTRAPALTRAPPLRKGAAASATPRAIAAPRGARISASDLAALRRYIYARERGTEPLREDQAAALRFLPPSKGAPKRRGPRRRTERPLGDRRVWLGITATALVAWAIDTGQAGNRTKAIELVSTALGVPFWTVRREWLARKLTAAQTQAAKHHFALAFRRRIKLLRNRFPELGRDDVTIMDFLRNPETRDRLRELDSRRHDD